jgi:hypothetical protein
MDTPTENSRGASTLPPGVGSATGTPRPVPATPSAVAASSTPEPAKRERADEADLDIPAFIREFKRNQD